MTSPVLVITRDDLLLDDLLRLAAAAGTTLDVAHDTTAALRGWGAASVVLLGADLARAIAAQRPSRRDHVHVVAHGPVPDGLFRAALATGALDVVELPAADAWLVELLTDAADGGAHLARTFGVVGGSGGAGATTFASALALTAAAIGPAVLLDLETYQQMLEAMDELDDIRAYDAAKANQGEEDLIPIEQAMAEFEERTSKRKAD